VRQRHSAVPASTLLSPALTTLAFLLALLGAALTAALPGHPAAGLASLILGFACFLAGTAITLVAVTKTASAEDPPHDSPLLPLKPVRSLDDLAAPGVWESEEELQEFLRDTYAARCRPPEPEAHPEPGDTP
jgi:hypothetical protein